MRKVVIHTDGSCWPNPGPGAWAFHLMEGELVMERSGKSDGPSTNNRMELTAAIKALEHLPEPCSVTIITDSEYLKNGASSWMWRWHRKEWKGVKNPDLWKEIWRLCGIHNVIWQWVRGHADCSLNNRVDVLAEQARNTP